MKPGILIEIPGFGKMEFRAIVSDYTGSRKEYVLYGTATRFIVIIALANTITYIEYRVIAAEKSINKSTHCRWSLV